MTILLRRQVLEQVKSEHRAIRSLLDAIEAAPTVAALQPYLWDLYLCFNDHLDMEERDIAPVLRARAEHLSAAKMILEHNEQRRVVRELVEDLERDAKPERDLLGRAAALVAMLRADIVHEEAALEPIASVTGSDGEVTR